MVKLYTYKNSNNQKEKKSGAIQFQKPLSLNKIYTRLAIPTLLLLSLDPDGSRCRDPLAGHPCGWERPTKASPR